MHISKVATISGSFCLSMGQVQPEVVDVGKVGYENSWKEIRIPIELKNLSEVALVAKFELSSPSGALFLLNASTPSPLPSPVPSPIPSPSLSARRGSMPDMSEPVTKIPQPPPVPLQPRDSVVPVSESKFFTLVLDVSKLERNAGPFSCRASFINVNNPHNKMYVLMEVMMKVLLILFKGCEHKWNCYFVCSQVWKV